MTVRSVTLLHGFLGLPSSMSTFARALRNALGVPVRAVLLPGHGHSPWGLEAKSFDDAVTALRTRVFTREPDGEVLIGYSMGGRLALGLAALLPGLERVLAVGAHLGFEDASEESVRAAADDERAKQVLERGIDRFAEGWAREPIFATQRELPEAIQREQARTRASHTERGIAWALTTLGTGRKPDLRSRLAKSGARVELIAGEHDSKFVQHHRSLDRLRLPQVRCSTVPSCGHNPFLEDPIGALAAIRAALTSTRTNHSLSINGA